MSEREEFKEEIKDNSDSVQPVRLTTRDKELLAHVATARYLTLVQLRKLVFGAPLNARAKARANEGPSELTCKRRLVKLCAGETPYLRRLQYRDAEGAMTTAYGATIHGHSIARQHLRRTPAVHAQDIKPQFLEHTLRLNDLYVALAEGCARQRVTPPRYPFWWISTETSGLPWRERNQLTGKIEDRRLIPDSILELTGERCRDFLECEMGGHPLVRRDEDAIGSALSKLQRYGAFMLEGGQKTFYAQKYPDGWKAELVFLMHSEQRAANLVAIIDQWRGQNRAVPLVARALSFGQAAVHFRARLKLPAPPAPGVSVQPADLELTCAFVSEVTATYKAVRHFLRANPTLRAQGCPYPEYSTDFERMVALVERFRTQVGPKP